MAQENQSDPVVPYPIRRLAAGDNAKGFTALLSQLSSCPPIPDPDFLSLLSSLPADHLVCVAEDPSSSRVVATGSCFVERKFFRGCGKVGHIEDVVVDSSVRGKKLGQKVVEYLTEHARSEGCYKVILDCAPENRGFYEKCGFVEKNVQMAIYF
ncbi:glucosamine 6-phosphate N-acetyltransferase-like [Iris pallida]|uniref:Glucosamine 6-phosphate N-acetyltransferase n=1 Tax=Iris pallida TaxID=29817 RepID=A0AAX6F9W8_IRIPA|nr:glucosamine 6-phosphate N-acetyltransferase-like [Iris pallida]